VAIGFLVLFGQYVHRGYLGVMGSGEDLRLLDHGLHLRAPWKRVTIYPIRCREIHLETFGEVRQGKIHFDGVLLLSVDRDSVVSLHRTYHGAYIDRLVSPVVVEFIGDYGDAYGVWHGQYNRQQVTEALADHLNSALAGSGINVINLWLRSLEAESDSQIYPSLDGL
jgi:hypothetical protein